MKKQLTKKQKDRRDTIEAIVGGIFVAVFAFLFAYGMAILEALFC